MVRFPAVGAVAACLLGMLPAGLGGQTISGSEAWRWAQYGRAEGLPAGGVSDIAETTDGTVWVATDAGLAWFDGFLWHAVGTAQGVPGSPGGRLVPVAGGGLLAVVHGRLFRGDSSGFEALPVLVPGSALEPGGSADPAEQAVEAATSLGPDDYLILARVSGEPSARRALVRLRRGRSVVLPPPIPLTGMAGLFTTRQGKVYLSAAGAVYRWRSRDWERVQSFAGGGAVLASLAENAMGDALAFVMHPESDRGLVEWDAGGRARRVVAEGITPAVGLDVGPFGNAFAVYASGHVRMRERGRWGDAPSLPPGLRRSARAVRVGDDGTLWFGAEDGVYVYRAAARRWVGWSFPFPDQRARVNAIAVRRSGAVWTGTGDGVVVYRPDRTEPEWIPAAEGIRLGVVTGLAEDGEGMVWVTSGASFPGAFRWDGRAWRHFGTRDGLAAPRVHRVMVDRRGRPWFLGIGAPGDVTGGPGAFVYDDGRFERWGVDEGLPSGRVYGFADAPDSALWFATLAGVSRWRAGVWTHWTRGRTTLSGGLPLNVALAVRSVAVGAGRVWLGDRSLGVGFLDEADSLHFHSRVDGLASVEIRDVQVDESGVVWAGTAGGLCFFRDDIGEWSCLGPSVGLATGNVWPVVPHRQGIYVGTQGEGLQVLSRAGTADPPPRVVFAAPIVEGRTVRVGWAPFAFQGALPGSEIRTRYRIDASPWSRWSLDRDVSLAGMRRGRHTVQVQARGLLGEYDADGAVLAVTVPLPLVLRPAFAIPVGTLLLALGGLVAVALEHRRRAVRTLRASEARFRALGEAAFEGIGFATRAGIIEVNERLAEMLGYTREELIGAPSDIMVAPRSRDDVQRLEAVLNRRVPTDGPVPFEGWARRKDGSEFPAEVQIKVMPLGDRLVRVMAMRDISDRRAAEAALRRSEQKFARAFWASPDAIDIAREADGRFIEVNEAFVRLSGRPRDQVIGRTGAEIGLWVDEADREAYWGRLRAEGRVRSFETRLQAAEGEVRDCVISAERLEIGGETCALALTRDVTGLKRAEAALRMTQFSVDHAAEAVLWVDPDGRIGYANLAAAASLEWEGAGLVGTPVSEVNEAWTPAAWREFWTLVKRQGATQRVCTFRTRRGHAFPVEILCRHMVVEGREHLVVGARDISERVAAEQALVENQRTLRTLTRQLMAAQEAERARISRELHDEIGQTLAAVKLNLQAIGRMTADERIASQVGDGIAVVDATVGEVRNLSRDLRPSVLDDLGLVAALQWYLERQAERAGLTVTFVPEPDLPRAPREIETACYRIVQEALTNVVRHAQAGRVDVLVAMDGSDLVLSVRDDGRGFNLRSAAVHDGGPPHLGLVGMRERAENAGGVLTIESTPGLGTTVRARFDTRRRGAGETADVR